MCIRDRDSCFWLLSPCSSLVTLDVQFLCSDWSKFDRWVHAENLYSVLNLVYFDSWSWQSFVSTCDVFNCLFPLNVQNEIQLLSGVLCYSWLVCLLGRTIWKLYIPFFLHKWTIQKRKMSKRKFSLKIRISMHWIITKKQLSSPSKPLS